MRFLSILAISIFTCSMSFAQGIEFFQGTWQEALEEAQKQDKIIFVDAYAVWCGPCKRMAKNVFPQEKVGDFHNKNFINMKLDMEKGEGLKFRQKYPVGAFPTLFYIDYDGEVVHQVRGAQQADGLLKLGEMVLRKIDRSGNFAAEYEKGNRDPELIYKYVQALNKAGKPSLKISNEYLRSQDNLTTEFNLQFIYEAAIEADSRIFTLLTSYQKEIGMLVGLQGLRDRIELACQNTLNKAVEFQNAELLEEAKSKMSTHYPQKATNFALLADMEFYKVTADHKKYMKACSAYAKKVAQGNAKDLNNLATDIAKSFGTDEKCMKQAEKFAKEAAEKGGLYNYYLTYATILNKNGKKEEALKVAGKSLQLAKEVGAGAERSVQYFIQQLEG